MGNRLHKENKQITLNNMRVNGDSSKSEVGSGHDGKITVIPFITMYLKHGPDTV